MKNIAGIVPPLVTPLTDHDTLDTSGAERLIEHVIDGGVSGIFILGTTGEAPSLSYRLRREFVRLICDRVNGRVPVLVGVTDTSFVETIELAKVASDCGAAASVLSTPYYFPAGQTELRRYVGRVCDNMPLPIMLYNMPSLTKVWFETDTLLQLADLPQIVGVKDSSGDMDYFTSLLQLKQTRPDWTLMIGPEHLTAEAVRRGGDGGVNGGANLYPKLFVELYRATKDGDEARCQQLQSHVERLQEIYAVGKYASRFIKATKSALSIKAICSDHMAEPFNHFLAPQREQVQQILLRIDNELTSTG